MSRRARVTRIPNGYSLIELMIVVAIMGVVSSIALFQVGNLRPYLKGDGAMRTVIGQMNTARELSITQRRSIQVAFVGNIITLTRQDIPAGTTVLAWRWTPVGAAHREWTRWRRLSACARRGSSSSYT